MEKAKKEWLVQRGIDRVLIQNSVVPKKCTFGTICSVSEPCLFCQSVQISEDILTEED